MVGGGGGSVEPPEPSGKAVGGRWLSCNEMRKKKRWGRREDKVERVDGFEMLILDSMAQIFE